MIARDLALVRLTGGRLHVAHLSTAGAAALIREAKAQGLAVTAEVTPHHLFLTEEVVEGYGTDAKMAPPLRTRADVDALRAALADGTIDAIATDHAPHAVREKDCEFSEARPGAMGLELCLGVLLGLVRDGTVSLGRLVDALSAQPARIAGVAAPSLRPDSPASMALVDPSLAWVPERVPLHTKSRNTPFAGTPVIGRVLLTFAHGRIVHDGIRHVEGAS
jgi:dihydroorotase